MTAQPGKAEPDSDTEGAPSVSALVKRKKPLVLQPSSPSGKHALDLPPSELEPSPNSPTHHQTPPRPPKLPKLLRQPAPVAATSSVAASIHAPAPPPPATTMAAPKAEIKIQGAKDFDGQPEHAQ